MPRERKAAPQGRDWPPEKTLRFLRQQLDDLQKFRGRNWREVDRDEQEWQQFTTSVITHGFGSESQNLGNFNMARWAGEQSMMGISDYQRQLNFQERIEEFQAALKSSIKELDADLIDPEIGAAAAVQAPAKADSPARTLLDPEKVGRVFVVHGRDERLRKGVFDFLRSIQLTPIEWSEAIRLTGKASPYVGEILETAFRHAQAVVVLLSPDDQTKLRTDLLNEHDPPYEKTLTGQPRPNVLFEAGMAFASHPDNTVLVQIGSVRPFSDVAGRHILRMDGSAAKRKDLAQRLDTAGCSVNLRGNDWLEAGDLTAIAERAEGAPPAPESQRSSAVDQDTYKFVAERWKQLKDPELREAVCLLLREDLTTKQALNFLHQKGLAMNWVGVYDGIAEKTNLVHRVVPARQPDEHVHGYTGPWTINPKFRSALQSLLELERTEHGRIS